MTQDFSRRDFGRLALGAAPLVLAPSFGVARGKPNSRIHGVQIGIISSSLVGTPADQIIPTMVKLGISEVELQSAHAEALAGAPVPPVAPAPPQGPLNADGLIKRCEGMEMVVPYRTTGGENPTRPLTPTQQADLDKLWVWRRQQTPATWAAVRKTFDAAGIDLRVLWYGLGFNAPPEPTDEEIDYAFSMGKGLGVRSMSGSSQMYIAPRIAKGAVKYGQTWAGHTQDNIHNPDQFATPEAYDRLLALSPAMRICLDVGYFGAAGFDTLGFIRKNHRMITEIHLKDRKLSKSLGGDVTNNTLNNWPWGEGNSHIREVLQLLKKEKYDIPVQIEYNYACRTPNDAVTEVARCLEFCKAALA